MAGDQPFVFPPGTVAQEIKIVVVDKINVDLPVAIELEVIACIEPGEKNGFLILCIQMYNPYVILCNSRLLSLQNYTGKYMRIHRQR